MPNTPIDELSIEIGAEGQSAEAKIDKFTQSLKNLRNAVADLSDLKSLTKDIRALTEPVTDKNKTQVEKFTQSLRKLSKLDFGKASEGVRTLYDTISKFDTLPDGVTEVANAMSTLAKETSKATKTADKLRNKGKSVTPIKATPAKTTNDTSTPISSTAPLKGVVSTDYGFKELNKDLSEAASKLPIVNKLQSAFSGLNAKARETGSSVKNFAQDLGSSASKLPMVVKLKDGFSNLKNQAQETGNSVKNFARDLGSTASKLPVITKLKSSFSDIKNKAKETGNSIKTFGQEVGGAFSKYHAVNKLKNSFSGVKSKAKGAKDEVKDLDRSIKKTGKDGSNSIGTKLVNAFKKLNSHIKQSQRGSRSFGQYLKEAFKSVIVYGGLFKLFSSLGTGLTEGMQNMAKGSERFNKTMSILATNMLWVKNIVATTLAPVLNALAPIVDALSEKFYNLANKVGMFFARMLGQKTFTVAKKTQVDYAASLDSTSSSADKAKDSVEQLKKTITSFDELNIINQQSSSSSSSSSSSGYDVPTGDFDEWEINKSVSSFADKLKEAWKKADFTGVGESLADKLNEQINKVNNIDWEDVQNKINTKIRGVVDGVNGFINRLEWGKMGQNLANGFNTALSGLNAALERFEFDTLGEKLGDFLLNTFKNIKWNEVGEFVNNILTGLCDFLAGLFTGLTSEDDESTTVADGIKDFLEGLDIKDITIHLANLLVSVAEWEFKTAQDFASGIAKWIGSEAQSFFDWAFGGSENSPEWIGEGVAKAIYYGILTFIQTKCPFLSIGDELIDRLKDSVNMDESGESKDFKETGENMATSMTDGLTEQASKDQSKAESAGKGITASFKSGIGDMWSQCKPNFESLTANIKSFFSGKSLFNVKVTSVAKAFLGTTIQVPQFSYYATGGQPQKGEMFVARENGMPEMVGRMGNRTTVMNNDQIVDSVSTGVASAVYRVMSEVMSTRNEQPITINNRMTLDGKVVYEDVVSRHNSEVKRTGSSPLMVGA